MTASILVTAIEVGALVILFTIIYRGISTVLTTIAPSTINHRTSRAARYRRRIGIFLLLLCTVLCFTLAVVNGYILYQGNNVLEVQQSWLQTVPQGFWQVASASVGQCLLLILVVKFALSGVHNALRRLDKAAKNYDRLQGNDASIGRFFQFLSQAISIGAWLWIALLCIQLLGFPAGAIALIDWLLNGYMIAVLGLLFVKAIPILVDTLDAMSVQLLDNDDVLNIYTKMGGIVPLFKRCLEFIVYFGIASIILRSTNSISWLSRYTDQSIQIIASYFIARFSIDTIMVVVDEFTKRDTGLNDVRRQQRLTIAPLIKSFSKYAIYFGLTVHVLNIINIDPTPILAGAGILGLAIGFGAQHLIEDVVAGFLILFENHYLVGDYIAAGKLEERPVEGVVESIELRTTQLRHPDGQLQIIRNGEIGSIVNYSKQYIFAKVDIPLAYETPLEQVYTIIDQLGQQLHAEAPEIVLAPTQVEGLESLGKSLVLLRTITRVKPGKHQHIQRLLRQRLKDEFEQAQITLSDYEPETKTERAV